MLPGSLGLQNAVSVPVYCTVMNVSRILSTTVVASSISQSAIFQWPWCICMYDDLMDAVRQRWFEPPGSTEL